MGVKNMMLKIFGKSKPVFKIFKGKDRQFYFTLIAPNGEPVCQSEGYKSLQGCKKGIRAVIKYSKIATIYYNKTDSAIGKIPK